MLIRLDNSFLFQHNIIEKEVLMYSGQSKSRNLIYCIAFIKTKSRTAINNSPVSGIKVFWTKKHTLFS